MNITLLLFTSIALNLNITLKRFEDDYQDFFYFASNESEAHLFRENNTILLSTRFGNNRSLYETTSHDDIWYYSWPTSVSGKEMSLLYGEYSDLKFDSLIFVNTAGESIADTMEKCVLEEGGRMYLLFLLILCFPGIFISPKIREFVKNVVNNNKEKLGGL